MKQIAVVCGASGFIGRHLVARLIADGYKVRGLSRRPFHGIFQDTGGEHEFYTVDLRRVHSNDWLFKDVTCVYQLACEVGGLGYISDRINASDCLRNSTLIDINVLEACRFFKVPKVFFASSACVYNVPGKRFYEEKDAYPANCSNEFAWQKLFAERLYEAAAQNYGIGVKIGRLFNTYGTGMTWFGGREKSVAALCRKIAEADEFGTIEVWGSGEQTRSYTYIDDCIEGIRRLMDSNVCVPVNIGPASEVTIRDLIKAINREAHKSTMARFGEGPAGVSKICSDNTLVRRLLDWEPRVTIEEGLQTVYPWVVKQVLDKTA